MNLHTGFVAAFCGALVTAGASASVTFSFSSDDNGDGPTFQGFQDSPTSPVNSLLDGGDMDGSGDVVVGLTVDANGDLPGGGTTFDSIFNFSGTTTGYSVTALGDGFLHNWTLDGTFNFVETGTGLTVLSITFDNAIFSAFSDENFMLQSSATLQANSATSDIVFTPGAPLIGLGIEAADLAVGESFAFGLSNMVSAETPGEPLHLFEGGGWAHHWIAEGSFSAAASAIPTPGALALLICGLFVGFSRRRTA